LGDIRNTLTRMRRCAGTGDRMHKKVLSARGSAGAGKRGSRAAGHLGLRTNVPKGGLPLVNDFAAAAMPLEIGGCFERRYS